MSVTETPGGSLELWFGTIRDLPAMGLSTSFDGGRTWTPVYLPSFSPDQPRGNLLAAADGALLLPALHELWDDRWALVLRSPDRFRSHQGRQLDPEPVAADYTLFRAGSTLYLNNWDSTGSTPFGLTFRSSDEGSSWTTLPVAFIGGTFVGGPDGSIYYPDGRGPWLMRWTPAGAVSELGVLPATSERWAQAFRAVMVAPERVCMVYTENDLVSLPGAFFFCAGAGAAAGGVLRDDRIRALEPRPDVAASFPLPAYPTAVLQPGMADPEAAVLADTARPLVFYGLGFAAGAPLRLSESSGRIHLHWQAPRRQRVEMASMARDSRWT